MEHRFGFVEETILIGGVVEGGENFSGEIVFFLR